MGIQSHHVRGNKKWLVFLLCCFDTRNNLRTTRDHMSTIHVLVSAASRHKLGNPPPLKQKNLFLGCYRQTGTHTVAHCHSPLSVFLVETKSITLIPTDVSFTLVLLQMCRAEGQIVINTRIITRKGARKGCLPKPPERTAYLGLGYSMTVVPLLVLIPES